MMKMNHPYHLVNASPWPLMGSIGAMTMTSGMISWLHLNNMNIYNLGIIVIMMTMIQWWRDIIREATFQGHHTKKVMKGMKMGMVLFIISEIMFFMSFFWCFFHSSLSPNMEIGMIWPPKNIQTFNPMSIPLLNTIILLSSGVSMTWAHHSLMEKKHQKTIISMIITVMLGIYFSILQMFEYLEATFTFNDSIYGSCFFMATGFHGIHVIIGTIFLLISLMRLIYYQLSNNHHFGLEAAAWYWHFVDVVWLFLYISIYWWGS
uniref:Cytochrome c oxidase subunit 3 n=1 Tax=Polytoxus fuscovittatus TaxID=1347745 RepID=A0A7I6HBU1_9HEMI|nr:cytochrome c oxidase subunit III [Polytoxus fuscovittatus]